jgi:phosphosulfolactate synthase (CoM biosynthesis protein A)
MEKVICQDCKGNGYIKTLFEEGREWVITDCQTCKNQGEIMMDKERLESILNKSSKSLNTERLILDSKLVKELNGIIKKLNDEVDMLAKQKMYLQSKLREKDQNDTRR